MHSGGTSSHMHAKMDCQCLHTCTNRLLAPTRMCKQAASACVTLVAELAPPCICKQGYQHPHGSARTGGEVHALVYALASHSGGQQGTAWYSTMAHRLEIPDLEDSFLIKWISYSGLIYFSLHDVKLVVVVWNSTILPSISAYVLINQSMKNYYRISLQIKSQKSTQRRKLYKVEKPQKRTGRM